MGEPKNPKDAEEWNRLCQFPPSLEKLLPTRKNIVIDGWMSKQKPLVFGPTWERRWFVVYNNFLVSFPTNEPSAVLISAYYLPEATLRSVDDSESPAGMRPFVLELCPVVPKKPGESLKPVYLSLATPEQFEVWRAALKTAVEKPSQPKIKFGAPRNVQHLVHINVKETEHNFGTGLLSKEIMEWLKGQGVSEEDCAETDEKALNSMVLIAQNKSDRVGPESKLKQITSAKKINLEDFLSKGEIRKLYSNFSKLDSGSQGEVFKALRNADRETVAVKRVIVRNEQRELPGLTSEIAFLFACDHPNIVKLHECYRIGKDVSLVMEFMGGGKMTDIIDNEDGESVVFTEKQIAAIMYDVINGLEYLHRDGCMHRDIKSDNVLITSDGMIKLGDFGFAASVSGAAGNKRKTVVGTPYWMAPEVARGDMYDLHADIWSLGILFIELCDGLPPWMGVQPIKALLKISTSPPPTIKGTKRPLSDDAHDFAKCMLVKDAKKRQSCKELLKHPFLSAANREPDTTFLAPIIAKMKETSNPF